MRRLERPCEVSPYFCRLRRIRTPAVTAAVATPVPDSATGTVINQTLFIVSFMVFIISKCSDYTLQWCVVSKEVASGERAKFAVFFLPIEFLAQKNLGNEISKCGFPMLEPTPAIGTSHFLSTLGLFAKVLRSSVISLSTTRIMARARGRSEVIGHVVSGAKQRADWALREEISCRFFGK